MIDHQRPIFLNPIPIWNTKENGIQSIKSYSPNNSFLLNEPPKKSGRRKNFGAKNFNK